MVYKKYSAMKFSRKGRRVGARYTPRKRPKDAGRFEVEDAAREIKGSASGPNLSVPASSAESDSFAGTRKSTYEDGYPYYSADFDDTLQEAQTDFMRPRLGKSNHVDIIDEFMGFKRVLGGFEYGPERLGWLINMHSTSISESRNQAKQRSALDLYFLEQDGGSFKATIIYDPYFYILCHDKPGAHDSVENYVMKNFKPYVSSVDRISKEDLSMKNHLVLPKIQLLKLSFRTVQDLLVVRKTLLQCVHRNEKTDKLCRMRRVESMVFQLSNALQEPEGTQLDPTLYIKELREYDVPYYIRIAMDLDIRVGSWYRVSFQNQNVILEVQNHILRRPDPVVLAFDIETTKQPLKFPESSIDSIMMISYMVDEMGFLIVNREIISEDIKSFEYTPKPEYEGQFTIFNEPSEKALIQRFLRHIKAVKPTVVVTYNGDHFDWPFIEDRARILDIDIGNEIGFYKSASGEYLSTYSCHIDCLYWVKRDSYLPQGSHGLKTVTKAKLGYNPIEIDPEDMTKFAIESPQILSQYSVSDALSTYYLYIKHIHPFIFSLCNIIPMNPDDVLRKGSGTLCESLLMVEASKAGVLIPNKHTGESSKFFEGHLLESETYVGGHVEALEAGVFRQDLPVSFSLSRTMIQELLEKVDEMLKFAITVECNLEVDSIVNYEEIKSSIVTSLERFKECSNFTECPLIYHFDVGAMYPNIILTNRLQPYSIVNDKFCGTCDFYDGPETKCRKNIKWLRRGDYFPPEMNEYNMIVNQLKTEKYFDDNGNFLRFEELKREVQDTKIKERLSIYSKKIYNRVRISKVVEEESTVCQRENPFYVNTVRSFRDKRYQYKSDLKKCKEDLSKTNDPSRIIELQSLSVIYDSLQLAHKCILNSFYGYVMRKGARWYSMEMAGIVCLIGAEIIQMARSVVENLGKPLELDTDGIWCIIPSSFPGRFVLNVKDSTSRSIFYPCVILNKMVHERFTNDVYMDLVDPSTKTYATRSENSIFFEVDGPYRAMILPSSSKEDKLIKKRYAVFNKDGSLAEIKGFEVKRRGELKLIKIFQSQIFSVFLEGCTIDECYKAVASVANQWLDVLYSKGACLEDSELFDLISENRNMRRSLDEYGSQKSTSISTAKKLAELLGDQMVKHKGLNCKYVICNRPAGLPVSERAIPCVIFQAEPAIRKHYLRKWLGDGKCITDIREALDWKYYLERFGNVVQKIITVPASMQNVQNYVPRIPHPDWLQKKLKNNERSSSCGKSDLIGAFHAASLKNAGPAASGQASADRTGIIEDKVAQPVCDIVRDAATKDKEKILDQYCKLNVNAAVGSKREHGSFMLDPRNYSTYQGWLSDIKKKWSLITKLRGSGELQKIDGVKYNMRENGLPFTSEVGAKGRSNSLLSTMRGQDNTLFGDQKRVFMTSSWNVIHIRETDSPGVLSMWIVVGDFLQEIKLNVKRIIYINCTTNDIESLALRDEVSVKRESHRLLSGTQVYNIYSLKMPEKFYRNNMMMFSSISNHPNIEGVYEDNVSLSTYALIKLGSVVKVKSNASYVQNTLFSSGIDIEDIENQSHLKNKKPIFPFNNVRFDIVYVFYMHLECGLFIGSCKSGSNIIEVLIYDPYIKGKVNTKNEAEYEAMYISLLKIPRYSYLDSNGCSRAQRNFVDYPAEAKFSIRYLESEEQVHEGAKEVFERLARGKCRPILLILQPSVEVSHMISRGLNFINKYPFMTLPLHNEYKKYQFLNWKDSVIRYMLIHYFDLNRSIQAKVEVSTLSDIPLCNIPHDYPIFVTDISFARRMKQANIIIEWSESASSRRNNASQNFSLYTSELKYPEVNIKGCYSTLCFELELQDLILAPLLGMGLNSDNKFLYGGNFVSAQKTVIGYDPRKPVNHSKSLHVEENATEVLYHRGRLINTDIPVIALDILKSIIMGWAEDVHRENLYSAVLLSNVHRWFTSSSSTMSTPALYHKIFIQMRHCFMNLITEIELLGGKTIYASFDKLVIATQNTSMSLCLSSVKQIIRSIRSNSMFGAITFNFVRYWRYLLWMDPYNYGGISVDLSSELDIPREERDYLSQDGSDNNKATPMLAEGGGENSITVNEKGYNCELDMFWCIAYCLCPKYRSIFVKCIGQFISMFKYGSGAPSKNETVNYLEQEAGEKSTFDAKTYINKNLKAMLIGIISDMPEKSESEQDKSGGRLEHEDSYVYQKVLMVTYICESLGLDQDLKRDIDHLKSDLFSLLGVSEFSCYGEFTNPFERIRMSNYFCLFCSETRTLDINIRHNCDPLRPEDSGGLVAVILNEEPVMQSLFSWKCKKCGCDYDIGQVEQEIIQVLKFDMLSWHLQDPVCERCKITKIEDLRETCSNCSGKVVSVLPLATYQRRFRALHNLSHSLNKLPILKEMTSRLMNYVG